MKGIIRLISVLFALTILISACTSNYKSIDETVSASGQKLTDIQKAEPFSFFPVVGQVSSHFGFRNDPHSDKRKLHKGLDIRAPIGESVIAPGAGQVMFAGSQNGYGLVIEILHDNQLTTRYAHLDKILVKQPQRVEQGQLIGLSGQTGNATGPHLHYEILHKGEQIDPFVYTTSKEIRYANGKQM